MNQLRFTPSKHLKKTICILVLWKMKKWPEMVKKTAIRAGRSGRLLLDGDPLISYIVVSLVWAEKYSWKVHICIHYYIQMRFMSMIDGHFTMRYTYFPKLRQIYVYEIILSSIESHTAWMSIWMTKRKAITTDAF